MYTSWHSYKCTYISWKTQLSWLINIYSSWKKNLIGKGMDFLQISRYESGLRIQQTIGNKSRLQRDSRPINRERSFHKDHANMPLKMWISQFWASSAIAQCLVIFGSAYKSLLCINVPEVLSCACCEFRVISYLDPPKVVKVYFGPIRLL